MVVECYKFVNQTNFVSEANSAIPKAKPAMPEPTGVEIRQLEFALFAAMQA